ncbi:hypothetical protein [Paucimonas lemoignei]|uniref:hypothetical protein n=1 Tax=Paucimonas lemoignei TaxID=29443 RepID=UPI00104DEB86|nr:hypothetical protein [Paucimonas lemoignei]
MFNHAPRSWIAGLVFAALAGCGGVSLSFVYFDDSSDHSAQDLSFQEIIPVLPTSIGDRRLVVVRDVSNWDALWREHTAGLSPSPSLPGVNFSQSMVAGIFLGPQMPCREVQITSVVRYFNPDHIDITFREANKLSATSCSASSDNPSKIIVLPYSTLPVNFIQID